MAIDDRSREAPNPRLLLLARVIAGLTLLGFVAGVVFSVADARQFGTPGGALGPLSELPFIIGFAAFPVVGYILATRRQDNALSWLMLGVGATFGMTAWLTSYATYAMHGGVGGRTAGAIAAAIDAPMWVPIVGVAGTFLILLFPDGHLPSPRWKWFARCLAAGLTVVFLAILFAPEALTESGFPDVQNPLGIEALRPALSLLLVLIVLLPVGVLGSLLSLVLRFRRSTGVERLQLRWLVTASGVVAVLYSAVLPLSLDSDWSGVGTPGWLSVLQSLAVLSFALIPLAIGVAVLRYRLFEIDVVINRAVLYGTLAVFITVVYAAIVVGVGALVGSQGNAVLSAIAAAVVALAFQPARRRAQRLADRLVYGKRATPYEVLSEFSDRIGNVYANAELLPRMAQALADGTGAARADVWVRIGEELRAEATWPPDEEAAPPMAVSAVVGDVSPTSMLEPVRHQGELLGALSIRKRPGDALTPMEDKLVRDLVAQAGLVMRNVTLTERLMDHIEQLRESRQRLVSAQDQERRRIERNIHDGAQQQLVALAVQLKLLADLVERQPEKARDLVEMLQRSATDALENLRDLARGIYPPLLADKGLVAALESQARKSLFAVTVDAQGVARYPQDIEAAVYFCSMEALQNAAKYADASAARVRLAHTDGHLTFEVADDGKGFDTSSTGAGTGLQGMIDRLAAIGGTITVQSSPGEGTTVTGDVPIST